MNMSSRHMAVLIRPRPHAEQAPWHRATSLRRAGYLDGERQPRTPRHWANR